MFWHCYLQKNSCPLNLCHCFKGSTFFAKATEFKSSSQHRWSFRSSKSTVIWVWSKLWLRWGHFGQYGPDAISKQQVSPNLTLTGEWAGLLTNNIIVNLIRIMSIFIHLDQYHPSSPCRSSWALTLSLLADWRINSERWEVPAASHEGEVTD